MNIKLTLQRNFQVISLNRLNKVEHYRMKITLFYAKLTVLMHTLYRIPNCVIDYYPHSELTINIAYRYDKYITYNSYI